MKNKQDHDSLKDILKKYRALFDNALIGICIINADGEIIETNRTLKKIARLTGVELFNTTFNQGRYIRTDGTEYAINELPGMRAIKEGIPVPDEEIGIAVDNKVVGWIQVNAAPINLSERLAIVITQDITDRKNLEIKIKTSEEKLRALFENSMDAIFLATPDGTIYSANPAACKMFDRSEKEIIRAGRNGIVDTADSRLDHGLKERELEGKFYGELTFIKKDGTKFPGELSSKVFTDSEGQQLTSIIIRDISEQKRAEAELKESEKKYRSLFESLQQGVFYQSANGNIVDINQAALDMLGLSSNEILGRTFFQAIRKVTDEKGISLTPEQLPSTIALSTGKPVKDMTIGVLSHRSEHFTWMVTNAIPICRNQQEKPHQVLVAMNNITSKKDTEHVLSKNESELSIIHENIADIVWSLDKNTRITYISPSVKKLLGYDVEYLLGKPILEFIAKEYHQSARQNIQQRLTQEKEGGHVYYQYDMVALDGTKIPIEVSSNPIWDKDGTLLGFTGVTRDITRQKKLEAEGRRSNELLEKLNQHLLDVRENERNQIALNLHDDLGQKLTAINLDISWLKSRIGVQSKTVKEKIKEMSLMIMETIESIKETSSLLRPAILFDLGLVSAIKTQLIHFEKQTGTKCHFYCEPEEFMLDNRIALILYRIFQESLTNIARHSGASATEIILHVQKNKIEMLIKDNGIGIEEDQINSLKSMGIAGIKERVKSVQGKIAIIGVHGSGTTVKVLIPIKKEKKDDQSANYR
jgi:PAS domain S-box-containing protein